VTQWTKEPPKEAGWYWRRKWNGPHDWVLKAICVQWNEPERAWIKPGRVLQAAGDRCIDPINDPEYRAELRPLAPHPRYEWWPTPLTPPEST
jgi:hypothetical protein